jgi:hypothetical protein
MIEPMREDGLFRPPQGYYVTLSDRTGWFVHQRANNVNMYMDLSGKDGNSAG